MEKQLFSWAVRYEEDPLVVVFEEVELLKQVGPYPAGSQFASACIDYQRGQMGFCDDAGEEMAQFELELHPKLLSLSVADIFIYYGVPRQAITMLVYDNIVLRRPLDTFEAGTWFPQAIFDTHSNQLTFYTKQNVEMEVAAVFEFKGSTIQRIL